MKRHAEKGSTILGVIALMLLVSVLGVSLLSLLSSSSEGNLIFGKGEQAFFMAESGARYALTNILKDREAAVPVLDGHRFTLGSNAFELAVEIRDISGKTYFLIDSTGITDLGTVTECRAINGYKVEFPEVPSTSTPFNYAALITGNHPTTLSGSSYIDSYNSSSPTMSWIGRGTYNGATVAVNLSKNAAELGWSTNIYGDLHVGIGADINHPLTVVNRLTNILGNNGIIPSPATTSPFLQPSVEEAEGEIPSPLIPLPGFVRNGSQTLQGNNYVASSSFGSGSADLTFSGQTFIKTGTTFTVEGGGSVEVQGNFSTLVASDFAVTGNRDGLVVAGNADISAGGSITVSRGSSMSIAGELDMDTMGNFTIDGGSQVVLSGSADIDIAGKFFLGGGSTFHIDGDVVVRTGQGFDIGGGSAITFGPSGSLTVYVEEGSVDLRSIAVNPNRTASRFLVICSSGVTEVEISGAAPVYAGIYAPAAEVQLTGSSSLFGAVVCHSLALSGSASLHYDQALQGSPETDLGYLRRMWISSGN